MAADPFLFLSEFGERRHVLKTKNSCTANTLSYMSLVISSKPDARRRATMLTWNAVTGRANYSLTRNHYIKIARN